MKPRRVELYLVIRKCSEGPYAKVIVRIQKASKIGVKGLYPGPDRDAVVVVVSVKKLDLAKGLFERNVRVGTGCAASNVDVHDAVLAGVEVVRDAERRRDLDRPRTRPEHRLAFEKLKRKLQCLAK